MRAFEAIILILICAHAHAYAFFAILCSKPFDWHPDTPNVREPEWQGLTLRARTSR